MDAAAGGLGDDAELAALRDVLAALGATAPRLVYRKTLRKADVDRYQTRLLIPCRSDGDASALAAFLTEDEKRRARHEVREPGYLCGIEVAFYDRHGRRFGTRLNWIESIRAYRLSGAGWGRFLRDNQLPEAMTAAKEIGRKLEVELWAFGSTELRLPERSAEGDYHHPDGVLGVAILIRI